MMNRRKSAASTIEDSAQGQTIIGLLVKTERGSSRIRTSRLASPAGLIPPYSDLVIDSPLVSAEHLRLMGVETSARSHIAVLCDSSHNGFSLNGVVHRRSNRRTIGGRVLRNSSIVLTHGDIIRIPGSDVVFTYSQPLHYQFPNRQEDGAPMAMRVFTNGDTHLEKPIGPWIIHNCLLGHGSWGVVNLGTHQAGGGVQFAIKTITLATAGSTHARLLLKELDIHRTIDHPNVLRLLDYVRESRTSPLESRIHLILDLVTGGDLFTYIDRCGGRPEDELRCITRQLVAGIRYLHEHDIVHLDLKPENILLQVPEAYPSILIADLGQASTRSLICQDLTSGTEHHRLYQDLGTMQYLCPEHLHGLLRQQRGLPALAYHGSRDTVGDLWWGDHCALDMWALGITIWFCATHSLPHGQFEDWASYGAGRLQKLITYNIESAQSIKSGTIDPVVSSTAPDEAREMIDCGDRLTPYRVEDAHGGSITASPIRELEHINRSQQLSGVRGVLVDSETARPLASKWQPHADLHDKARRLATLPLSDWQPRATWGRWSDTGIGFLDSLFALRVSSRLTAEQAESHVWLSQGGDLPDSYETR
ncbi:hypothetical protein IAU60_001876 [Kwoniella sp. DSM 27419]